MIFSLSACSIETPESLKKDPYHGLFKKKGRRAIENLPYQQLATVNIDTISSTLYELYLNELKLDPDYAKLDKQQRINKLINLILLAQKAKQEKLDKQRVLKEQIRLDALNRLAQAYLKKYSSSLVISNEDLERAYLKNYKFRKNQEYKTRHIVVKTRDQASALLRQLAKGADFKTLARKNSIGPSASFGGALEWFRPDKVDPAFAKAVISMRPGEMSRFPFKTKHGWHIVMLEAVRTTSPPPFEEVKATLYQQIKQSRIDNMVKKLNKRSEISVSTEF